MNDDWTRILEYTLGSISILGCFFIIFVFLCYKRLRSFPFESVVYLTISSMMTTFSYLLYYLDYTNEEEKVNITKCKIQAFTMIWFENSQYFWAALIGYSLYQSVVNFEENPIKTTWTKRLNFLFIGYGIPLILALVCLVRDVFGPSGSWCWIDTSPKDFSQPNHLEKNIFSMFFYFLVWVLICVNFFLTYRVVHFLDKNFITSSEREIVRGYIMKLLIYPIIQVACVFPGSINRLIQIFFDVEVDALHVIQVIALLMQGLMYAVAYGYTVQVRMMLLETIHNYCGCFCCCSKESRTVSIASESDNNTHRLFDKAEHNGEDHNITV